MTEYKSVNEAPLTYCLRHPQGHSHKVDIRPNRCLSPNALAAEQKIKHRTVGSCNYTIVSARNKLWHVLFVPPNVHLHHESRKHTKEMTMSILKKETQAVGH